MDLYLFFSDSAKFADIARNIYEGRGMVSTFSFFFRENFDGLLNSTYVNYGVLPFNFLSILFSFKLFGVSDFAVIATSFFYFFLILIFVFLLARRIYKSNLVGILSILAVGFNHDLINYAMQGASEMSFIFQIVAASYFVSLKKTWSNILAGTFLILMYFTRPLAFIYIAGIILYFFLLNFKTKKALIYFGLSVVFGFLTDRLLLAPLSENSFIYTILGRGTNVLSQVGAGQSASGQLRSGVLTYNFSILDSLKKVFYNVYNFYKLLPRIVNPYLFALFIIASVKFAKDKLKNSFKRASMFMVIVTFLVAAASIPFFRYLHPIIPLVYIIAIGTLVEVVSEFVNRRFVIVVPTLLVLFFAVGQTLGVVLLDSRFERNTHNVGKPPVYVLLSYKLRDNTNEDDIVITNLDTWGSWYGERKTVWFPLELKQLVDPETGKIPFDSIYLTSYLMDDENYYMGDSWRLIFNNPESPEKWTCEGCRQIAEEFRLKGVYRVDASEDYERQDSKAMLLVRK